MIDGVGRAGDNAHLPALAGQGASAHRSLRRADLDWIRIFAFGTLIVYHVALVFAPWDWHVVNSTRYDWLRTALLFTNPWRLSLLFLISGAAMGFLSHRRAPKELLLERTRRLLPPLIFGVLLLVPPQAYVEAVEKWGYTGSYLQYWGEFFVVDRWFTADGRWVGLPVNHLWFLVYVWFYAMAACALVAAGDLTGRLRGWLERALAGRWVLLTPMLYLLVVRLALFPLFGLTNRVTNDWYNHASSFALFLFGFLLVKSDRVWDDLVRYRRAALAVAGAAFVVLAVSDRALWHPLGHASFNVAFAVEQWAAIVAILGFARKHLADRDGPIMRHLSKAVLPYYVFHQTITVIAAHYMRDAAMNDWLKAALLVTITFALCAAAYEVVRRTRLLAKVFSLPAPA